MHQVWNEMKFSMRPGKDVMLHVAEAGSGEPVVFLHGFPEFWYSWRHQLLHLNDRYHVIAPDLRGYNYSEKPRGAANYATGLICDDIVELIRGYGHEQATIVAHDWGGAVAWLLAARNAEVVKRLVIMNAPHPRDFEKLMFASFTQFKMSWYIFYFQLPFIPELTMGARQGEVIADVFRKTAVVKGAFTEDDLNAFKRAMMQPGALTAALNYYRAGGRNLLPGGTGKGWSGDKPKRSITAPTTVIWGTEDKALSLACTETMNERVDGPFRLELVENCGHWVQQERPEQVNSILDDVLKGEG